MQLTSTCLELIHSPLLLFEYSLIVLLQELRLDNYFPRYLLRAFGIELCVLDVNRQALIENLCLVYLTGLFCCLLLGLLIKMCLFSARVA